MAYDPIAERYAKALFETAKAEGQAERALDELIVIGDLLREHPLLRELLLNPDVDPEDKVGVFERSLGGAWSPLLRSFILMVVSLDRAESLPGIVEAFQALLDEDQDLLRAVVRSARALPGEALDRLRAVLERREGKRIDLKTEVDAELIGGMQIHLGHRVIDGSIQRQLADLRERLESVRVY